MNKLSIKLDMTIKTLYLRFASGIREAIKSGQLTAEESLPSARDLAEQLQTNRHTIMAAYQELIAQGWVESVERKGYKVARLLPIESSIKPAKKAKEPLSFQWSIKSPFEINSATKPAHEYHYNFTGGLPDINLFPFKEFKAAMSQSLTRPNIKGLNYDTNQGDPNFILQVKKYLRRIRSITDKEIICVNGSQEALYLISQVLLKPGDFVAVESLGYRPAWQAFESTGAKLLEISQHQQGIDIKHLTALIKQHKIKLIYLTPLHQYPTTVTLPLDERMAIYSLAAKYNVAIVEDDYDHEFHYQSQPLAPLAADDPSGLVIYLSTFSKIMFPGCRTGFIAVDKKLAPALVNYRTIINHKSNPLIQNAIGLWMLEGGFERHLRRMTKLYQQRRDHLVQQLNQYQAQGIALDYCLPAGGMAIWLDVKKQADELETYCKKNDVYIQSEQHFHLHPKNNQNRFIRLGFAGMDSEKLTKGLFIIFRFFNPTLPELPTFAKTD